MSFEIELEEVPQPTSNNIWAEKYRPKIFDTLIGNIPIKEISKIWLAEKEIPHILLHSSPGTGKTSLGKLLISHIPCDSLIINASDENSVDNIRNKVQDFAMTMGAMPLKIILLDEADRISPEAQDALRNLMETYSSSTRFILTANHIQKISPAIKSRCQDFAMTPPSKVEVLKHMVSILNAEKVTHTKEDLAFIVNSYFPDIRKIINFTQQSSKTGTLKISNSSSIDYDYKLKLVDLLKESIKNLSAFTEIRQLVADASFSNYEEIYKYLFTTVDSYAGKNSPEVILNLADAVYQNALVFEREITFVATMHKIIETIKK